ncbi:MAG TPA: protein kinase [Labilithrix sp.]|nr:protein kinase [Labilithrix sp.]
MKLVPSVKPGDVIAGKYRVERLLGSGGMGYVVAARHLQLDQLVAMKFLRNDASDNPEASARFLREAKAAAKLRSENIARIHDVGTLDTGEPYIVMEHLEGKDLSAITKERLSLPPGEACEYVMQACEALAEAHALGIIHRDIKLANLFITTGPAGAPLVKVLDFGISKTNPFGESEHEMTRAASLLGSPRFMSPEQMRDPRAVDGRTDVWSLGVVLYRAVAGKPPFEASALGRLITMVMHEKEAPLSTVKDDLPPGFEQVVARCLEKDPNARFANVAELAAALVPFCSDQTRARSAADRIAAVLSLPKKTPASGDATGPLPIVRSNRSDTPAGAKDTGTAAPWIGTHGGSRSTTTPMASIGLGVLLVGIVALATFFAKVRHDEEVAASGGAAPATSVAVVAPEAPASAPPSSAPTVVAPPALPRPEESRAVAPVGEARAPAPATTPGLARAEAQPNPRRTAPPPPVRTKVMTPSRPASKTEEGIPPTRE